MPFEQPQSIRTVFFDAGFTLVHPNPSMLEICQQVCAKLDLHLHLDQLRERLQDAEDFFLRQTRQRRYLWANEHMINEFWLDYYTNLLRPFVEEHDEKRLTEMANGIVIEFDQHTSWQLYPDVIPTLETLKAHGYTLGVISDWGISLSSILRHLGLTHYFDTVNISAATRYAKPSAQLYELALQRSNAISDYALHIGDSYIHDVLGARAVGMTPVLLDRLNRLQGQPIDCLTVTSLTELVNLLDVPR